MAPQKVGIREFREKLATYLLESDKAVAITRHGDTVGYYIPARRMRNDPERAALRREVSALVRVIMAFKSEGVSEGELLKDFKQWRRSRRK